MFYYTLNKNGSHFFASSLMASPKQYAHFYGWRNGGKFIKFIFIHIQCSYCYSQICLITFNNRIYIQEIYSFTFTGVFLITITFADIYEMSSFTFNVLYSFTFTIEIFIQHFLRTPFAHRSV